jgi:two-component system, NtrC family, nitrogen regulation sensor histidine kinase NtrY
MNYKNFRINVLAKIILLASTIFLLFYLFIVGYRVTPVFLGLLVIYQVYSLFQYVDKINRDLSGFLESIRFSEFSRSFQVKGMGSSFDGLNQAFNNVIKDFQEIRSEKEENYHYLQTILQSIDVCLMAYQKDGTIEIVNKAAKKLFQLNNIKNINALEPLSHELVHTLLNIRAGQNTLVKVQDAEDILQLSVYATEIKIKNKLITLVTINNLQNVLEEQETEAWQKLIRVLTHEIMNSITPIASISSTLNHIMNEVLENNTGGFEKTIDIQSISEFQQALQTINKRSTGLLHFVNTYRNLTRIPKPNFKIYSVRKLFENIKSLMEEELLENHICFTVSIEPEDIVFNADEQLIEQVMINLIKNSIYALKSTSGPHVEMRAFVNKRGRVTIQVIDNGVGILKDVLDKIFIPFFTTKPSGSGIGLSLSRQILRLHNGTITAHSIPDKETAFTLTF